MKLYTLADNRLRPAPTAVRVDGIIYANPTQATLRRAGIDAYPLAVDTPPTPPEGMVAVPTGGYEVYDGAWHRMYRYEDAPPSPPRHWTRLAIKTALAQAGMLAAAREYLATVAIADGYSAWEALTDCDYIEEGYPKADRWSAILDGAAQALGKTRMEIDAFLDAIPTEGVS